MIWKRLVSDLILVIAHPNSWEVEEQHFLRKVVLECECEDVTFSQVDVGKRLFFVKEAEASERHISLPHAVRSTGALKASISSCNITNPVESEPIT
jgi:hypothetical protein